MNKQTLFQLLEKNFNLFSDDLESSDKLREIGLDSLDFLVLISVLEKEIKVNISDKEMEKLKTIDDVLKLTNKKLLINKVK